MTTLILPPETLVQGRYRIERLISQGGMGAVYQATDQRLGNAVALKQILVSDTRLRKAFEREARLLASLRHPVLPVVSDHFIEHDGQFLVMQFIPGDDLGRVLERQNITFTSSSAVSQVLSWLDQLLDALDYLHSHDPPIIHRDIKPQNLKLTARSEIVLLDFGLAKGGSNQSISSTTGRSVRAYTAQYAPLEQIQGTGTDPRSDLYALAATIYHLLTGEAPPNALTRAAAVLSAKPDPLLPASKLNPNVPPTVAAILHQAMSHSMAKRFASAALMRTALLAVQQQSIPALRPSINSVGQQTVVVPVAAIPTHEAPGSVMDLSAARIQEIPAMAQVASSITDVPAAPTLIVSQKGRGHYQSIGAAIHNASPGSRILVRPGLYHESIVLNKQVELSGDGAAEEIIVESTDASCLLMQTDYATVRGLSLHGHATRPDTLQPTVSIPQGRLALEDCHITSTARLCVVIHGAAANPIIWRCQIHHSNGIGILVYGRGRGTIEECAIFNHTQAGIAIRQSGNPTIRSCKIYQCTQVGVYVDEKGRGTLEECDIWGNVRAGIEVKRGSNPMIRRCNLYSQTQGYGILVRESGEGIIEECDISENARAGIAVIQHSNPLVRRCKIRNERQRGVFFSEQGKGTFEDCEISGNARVGVEIRQGSHPTLRHCLINNHPIVAIWVHQGGAGHVEHCDLTDNTRGAWYIEEGSEISRHKNKE